MKIIGFNFNKISIERFSDKIEKLKINTNIDISEITDLKPDFFKTKEGVLKVNFSYKINYEPNFAKIEFVGHLLITLDQKTMKDVLKQWKDKKIPENFQINLFNIILRKSSIRALQLEDEMNLPLHISLPTVKQKGK